MYIPTTEIYTLSACAHIINPSPREIGNACERNTRSECLCFGCFIVPLCFCSSYSQPYSALRSILLSSWFNGLLLFFLFHPLSKFLVMVNFTLVLIACTLCVCLTLDRLFHLTNVSNSFVLFYFIRKICGIFYKIFIKFHCNYRDFPPNILDRINLKLDPLSS